MLQSFFINLFVVSLLVETITELCIKSFIFKPIRAKIFSLNSEFLTELFSCGYCFSVWVALGLNLSIYLVNSAIYSNSLLILVIVALLSHRISNIIHGSIDRYFDTRKDIRYNKD
jgi:hypothetical protein